jgi:hypothetical protein
MKPLQKILIVTLVLLAAFNTVAEAKGKKHKAKAKTQKTAGKQKGKKATKQTKGGAKKQTNAKSASTKAKPAAKGKTVARKATAGRVAAVSAEREEENVADTSAPKVVTVTSAFKPSLRNAAKVNFTAATPVIDTVKIPLAYRVPAQNLFFSYQPVPIKPVALEPDSSNLAAWENKQYVKVGYGNYATPYVEAGVSVGDSRKALTAIHAKYTSSKGSLAFQEAARLGVDVQGMYRVGQNHDLSGKLYYMGTKQYYYGFGNATTPYTKNDLKQQYTNIGFNLDLQSKLPNSSGLMYKPGVEVQYFGDNRNARELNAKVKLPLSKSFTETISFDLNFLADFTSLKTDLASVNNNIFSLNPKVQYKKDNFIVKAGLIPSWDDDGTHLLPDITVDAKLKDERFVLQAGLVGVLRKNSYATLAAYNPWIAQPQSLFNTQTVELFGGFKGSAGNHLTYNAKLGYIKYKGHPLFINDNIDGKSFQVLRESNLQALSIHGELGYAIQEKFSLLASTTINQFTKVGDYDKAFGLIPFEINGVLKWKVLKDLYLKSDLFFFDGSYYRDKLGEAKRLNAVVDLNAGFEYTVMPKLNVWVQFNNLFNNRYVRWNQYETLGLNVLGGIIYSFK